MGKVYHRGSGVPRALESHRQHRSLPRCLWMRLEIVGPNVFSWSEPIQMRYLRTNESASVIRHECSCQKNDEDRLHGGSGRESVLTNLGSADEMCENLFTFSDEYQDTPECMWTVQHQGRCRCTRGYLSCRVWMCLILQRTVFRNE